MQKILVLTETERAGESIRRTIEKALPYQVTYVNDLQGAKIQLESKLFNLIIFDCQTLDESGMTRVGWFRQATGDTPLILFTASIDNILLAKVEMLEALHVLMRPTAERNLITLVKKLVSLKDVPKQRYRRYNTNQSVVFEHTARGERIPSQMFNLSRGGAYCEFPEGQSLNMGERYRMQIFINETQRTYTLDAVVVWYTPKGKFSGRAGYGVKFLSR